MNIYKLFRFLILILIHFLIITCLHASECYWIVYENPGEPFPENDEEKNVIGKFTLKNRLDENGHIIVNEEKMISIIYNNKPQLIYYKKHTESDRNYVPLSYWFESYDGSIKRVIEGKIKNSKINLKYTINNKTIEKNIQINSSIVNSLIFYSNFEFYIRDQIKSYKEIKRPVFFEESGEIIEVVFNNMSVSNKKCDPKADYFTTIKMQYENLYIERNSNAVPLCILLPHINIRYVKVDDLKCNSKNSYNSLNLENLSYINISPISVELSENRKIQSAKVKIEYQDKLPLDTYPIPNDNRFQKLEENSNSIIITNIKPLNNKTGTIYNKNRAVIPNDLEIYKFDDIKRKAKIIIKEQKKLVIL
ncbi:MAG: hypothetical protein QXM07_09645 [Nitrososphaerota archaeon]